jgi:hypothetical protein
MIEAAALAELVPVLSATLESAVRRAIKDAPDAAAVLSRDHLMNGMEQSAVAAVIAQARVIPELLGRLRARANAGQVELAAPALTPAEFLDPERAILVQPEKAVEFFTALSPRRALPLPDNWLELHRRAAFELAVTTDKTALDRVHEIIREQLAEGQSVDWGTGRLEEILDGMGVTPKNPQYAEMVVRTNTMDAYNDGYEREVKDDPDLAPEFPWWEYLAIEDDRLGEDHAPNLTGGFDGGPYYPASRSFADVRGDRVFNCRCSFRWLHKTEAADLGLPLGDAA